LFSLLALLFGLAGNFFLAFPFSGKACFFFTLTLFFGLAPDAQVTVSEYETTMAPTITILRDIEIACQEEYLTITQPKFSWEAVPFATYYLVEVTLTTDGGDYAKEIQVSDTQVTWSALTPGKYSVWVRAYTEQDTLIGSGYDWFWIGPRP